MIRNFLANAVCSSRVCVFLRQKLCTPVSKLSGALWWRGGQRKESLQLYVSGIERRSRYDTLPW